MEKIKFTDVYIRSLLPKSSQYEVFDLHRSSFGIRVSPGGTKTFVLFYRMNGRKYRYSLGRYPQASLKDARAAAFDVEKEVHSGVNPHERKAKASQKEVQMSFGSRVDDYIVRYAQRQTRSWPETKRLLERNFVSSWDKKSLASIEKRLVNKALDEIHDNSGPSAANHAFAALRKFFNWCVERDYLVQSPCQGLRMPAKRVRRQRVLDDKELVSVWFASREMGYPFGPFIQLLMLTGQRRNEVAHLRWEDLDLGAKIWTQRTNKSNSVHLVPLSKQVINVIQEIPRIDDEFVFPGRGVKRPISGFSKWKKRLDEIAGVHDWTLHDLRRTLVTCLGPLGESQDTIDLVLNHSTERQRGLQGVYNTYTYEEEKRRALQKLADRYFEIFSALESGKVVL